MVTGSTRLTVRPDSELGRVLRRAVDAGEPVIVDTGDAVYELDVSCSASTGASVAEEPDALLGIIGIGASAEPTNIARDKDAYLAETLDPRRPQ